jgi:tetratricopeptide (TPR) repeat protein
MYPLLVDGLVLDVVPWPFVGPAAACWILGAADAPRDVTSADGGAGGDGDYWPARAALRTLRAVLTEPSSTLCDQCKSRQLAEHHHNPTQQAHTHHALAQAWEQRRDDQKALKHARRALAIFCGLDQPVWEARALNAVGWYAGRLGDYDTAREHCQAALTLLRHHNNPDGEADILDSLGYIDHHAGHHTQAIDHYHHALTLYRDRGHTYGVADTLDRLGHPHAALGQTEQARMVWREALQLYREQDRHDDATRVLHQRLDSRPPSVTGEAPAAPCALHRRLAVHLPRQRLAGAQDVRAGRSAVQPRRCGPT